MTYIINGLTILICILVSYWVSDYKIKKENKRRIETQRLVNRLTLS